MWIHSCDTSPITRTRGVTPVCFASVTFHTGEAHWFNMGFDPTKRPLGSPLGLSLKGAIIPMDVTSYRHTLVKLVLSSKPNRYRCWIPYHRGTNRSNQNNHLCLIPEHSPLTKVGHFGRGAMGENALKMCLLPFRPYDLKSIFFNCYTGAPQLFPLGVVLCWL